MIEEGYDLAIHVNPAPDESLSGVGAFPHDRLVDVHAWISPAPVGVSSFRASSGEGQVQRSGMS